MSETAEPKIQSKSACAEGVAAEFTDSKGLHTMFGIRRGMAYQLLDEGLIQSVSLKRAGRNRGKRLFDVASVRSFLSAQAQGAGR